MGLNLIILGPPGAGKGTQAELLARERGLPRISTGDILREAVQVGTALGRAAAETMNAGRLVGDEIMIGIIRERLDRSDTRRGFVLDGFPRTVAQAAALDALTLGRGPLIVVKIQVPEEELVRRVASRLVCTKCGFTARRRDSSAEETCERCGGVLVPRSDDGAETVRERLKVYQRDTKPLVDFYRGRRTFRVVDGNQTPERVAAELRRAVDSAHATEAGAGPRAGLVEPHL